MKISQYHKSKGHNVYFYKGLSSDLKNEKWDRIYISTLFTFYWTKTIKTIKYYIGSVKDISKIYVGGAMATLLANDIQYETGVHVVKGLLDKPGKLDYEDGIIVDALVPDYGMLDVANYRYPKNNAYFVYMTRSCPNNCDFCAVKKLEPYFDFKQYISVKKQIMKISKLYGEKKDLILLDNNVLASKKFNEIIAEIKDLGFAKGSKLNNKRRDVDFNQGLDGRRLTNDKMKLLSEIEIRPLRIAFDNIKYETSYIQNMRLAAECGINMLSNYILFNFNDSPEDFYRRLQINIELNEEFAERGYKTKIWSFPMKYVPLYGEASKDRRYVGKHWNKKYLRGIQCVLLATQGVVGPKRNFFEKAFGRDVDEFKRILIMPEDYIIHRFRHEEDGTTQSWLNAIDNLKNQKLEKTLSLIKENNFKQISNFAEDKKIFKVLQHYEQ